MKGACVGMDPNLFFPETEREVDKAKEVCKGCKVRLECLAYGWEEKHGIWGGTTATERRRRRKQANRRL